MAKVSGVVEYSQYPDKYGKHSIKVGGKFYSSKFQITANGKPVETGMNIEFEDGGKNYCQKAVLAGDAGEAPVGTPSLKDRMIVRQNALRHAGVIIAAITPAQSTFENDQEIVDRTLFFAKEFEKYSMCEDLTSPLAFED